VQTQSSSRGYEVIVGLLSDSHTKSSYQREVISKLKSKGAKYLIHAGDLIQRENLESLKESGLPYVAVFGNGDSNLYQFANIYNIKKEPYYFKIEDTTFKLMHLPYYMSADTNIVVYGHTHTFAIEYKGGTLFVNPGEVCAREKPIIECAVLKIESSYYKVIRMFRQIDTDIWHQEVYEYNK